MTIRTLDNVGIVVEDLAAVPRFFTELGLDVIAEDTVEGAYRLCYVNGPEGIIVMLAEDLG